jgi:pimeloyl-ACP methyl ester carboxylesterase
MLPIKSSEVDILEAGEGPLVVLVHSSVSGARQWRKLIELLARSHHVRAVNLFGYGRTPSWVTARSQTLADQAALIEAVVPEHATDVRLVGHSFGASVAMRAAAHLGSRVSRLVLLEPNPFYLLRDNGRMEAFGEAAGLCDVVKTRGARGEWSIAAEEFADYWGGSGTWKAMTPDRRATFAEALRPNFHEWDAVMNETTTLAAWSAQLPAKTLIVYDTNTARPIRRVDARCNNLANNSNTARWTHGSAVSSRPSVSNRCKVPSGLRTPVPMTPEWQPCSTAGRGGLSGP